MTADIILWAGAFGAGVALAAAYLALLWLSVRLLVQRSDSAAFQVMALLVQTLLRLGLIGAALLGAIFLDAPVTALAWAGAGFVLARITITAVVRRQNQRSA